MFGKSASLKCGLQTAKIAQASAAVIILADQPLITNKMINNIIQLYYQSNQH